MKCCICSCAFLNNNNNSDEDSSYRIDGLLLFRADRNHLSGNSRGWGLYVYINKCWCISCSPELVEDLSWLQWPKGREVTVGCRGEALDL
ncbi:uncharacterized protein AKAME5_000518900 [Lates japonicus]|uniref:Uncharacterized protein n=1 Tax=Lates japonicus TaxID=270547 RepID=A0AAD3R238_LATJO|nr:uncharacterized protein AKAME5_000518900 [Lates japonicus]